MSSGSRASAGPGPSSAAAAASSSSKPDRLYIGNLSPTIDEYTLIQVLQKYGSITNLDYMFHKSGALKGKPRGYAFVQYTSKDDALKAMVKLHDRLLRGRKLVVTSASSAPSTDLLLASKGRRSEPAKTTTLSLLKSSKKPHNAAAQIAAMEAKLAAMQSRKPTGENYVPGQSFRIPQQAGSQSPAPSQGADEEMDLEEELGLAEGKKAADDLEREMADMLGSGSGNISAGSSRIASPPIPPNVIDGAGSPITDTPRSPTSAPAPNSINSSLPPKPTSSTGNTIRAKPAPTSKVIATPLSLANLPKKPSFL